MKISKQARREAKQLFRACLVDGVLDEQRVREVVNKVVAAKPRGSIAILSDFLRRVKLELERRTASVNSAFPLPQALAAGITDRLNQVYGRGLNISFAQDPALLGGVRIQVGSDVYDGSVRARLDRLAEGF